MILSAIESRNVFDRSSILRYFSPCTPYPATMKFRARVEIGARSPGDRITPKKFTINFVSLSPLFLPFYSLFLSLSLSSSCVFPLPLTQHYFTHTIRHASVKDLIHSRLSKSNARTPTRVYILVVVLRIFASYNNFAVCFAQRVDLETCHHSFIIGLLSSLSLFHSLFPFSFFLQ